MQGTHRWLAPAAVVIAFGMSSTPTAQADSDDSQPTLGGGSGLVFGGSTKCSLTTIGYDAAGRLVGFTAGHCAEPGTPVQAEQSPDAGTIGVVRDGDEELDYAVIEFDASRVAPVRTVNGTTIAGFGAAPDAGNVVCQNGRTSGHACGIVWTSSPVGFMEQACSSYGDSGGPVTLGDQLVGMISAPLFTDTRNTRFSCTDTSNPVHSPVIAVAFDTVRAAVDAGKGVGSGFQPI
ncbi:hypothetical protein [Nocardia sp. NBC_00511]|uniref:hypothetical protein n=1 Tax=Nocardia sp. NBC_00511 TaxID=2903591 RepID=UPI0030E5A6D6